VRITAQKLDDKRAFDIQDLGDAEALISDAEFLDANARQLLVNMPEGWSGWLGELRRAAENTEQGRKRNFSLSI
jgi:hypothetical protein